MERRLHTIMAQIERENCINFVQLQYISVTDKVQINEQNKSIATGLLYIHTKLEAI